MKRPYDRALLHLIDISEHWDRWLYEFGKLLDESWGDYPKSVSAGFDRIKHQLLRDCGDDTVILQADPSPVSLNDDLPRKLLGYPIVWRQEGDHESDKSQSSHESHSTTPEEPYDR